MDNSAPDNWDVIIVGAGPTGLTLANILGRYGVKTLLVEQLADIIAYPRGVGMDDEALRTFQSLGIVDKIIEHTTPFHWMRFIWPSGRVMASMEPQAKPYGWSRRNAFNQPLVDRVLYTGLDRYPSVEVRFETRLVSVRQDDNNAIATVEHIASAEHIELKARYIVGTDGGRSEVRAHMGVTFDGKTAPDKFVVVDIRNDPIGRPNGEFHLDPHRPYVSIALPGGIRRLEFSVNDDEISNEIDVADDALKKKYEGIFSDSEFNRLDHIRRRVYSHNARIASSFRTGRLLLAGDAAHLMPVWQGQGFNTGIRDATNLGWKLAFVVNGFAGEQLLDTYTDERHPHAKQMIDVSVLIGRIFAPRSFLARTVRDIVFNTAALVPSWKRYITTMGWKPMPRFTRGAIIPSKYKNGKSGTIFFQPDVCGADGKIKKLDDALGNGPSVISWGSDVCAYLTPEEIASWRAIGGEFFTLFPSVQRDVVMKSKVGSVPLFDPDGKVKSALDNEPSTVFIIRPDRIIAAVARPVNISETLNAVLDATSIHPLVSEREPTSEDARQPQDERIQTA